MDADFVEVLFTAQTIMQGYVGFKWQWDQSNTVSPTPAITWPQGLHATKENHLEAAQVHGIVRPG